MLILISRGRLTLIVAACVSAGIAILHLVVAMIGAPAYRYFGGDALARLALAGSWQPALMTLVLAGLYVLFTLYGLSGAGLIRRLPLLGPGLLAIGALYGYRGFSLLDQIGQLLADPDAIPLRMLCYSLIALLTGIAYLLGALALWEELRPDG
jgi:hypothetical protein